MELRKIFHLARTAVLFFKKAPRFAGWLVTQLSAHIKENVQKFIKFSTKFSRLLPPQSNNANMGIIADNISTLLEAALHNQESGFSFLQAENVDTDTAVGVNSGSRNTWYLGPGLSLSYSQVPLKL